MPFEEDFQKLNEKLDQASLKLTLEDESHNYIITQVELIKSHLNNQSEEMTAIRLDLESIKDKQAPIAEAWQDIAAAARVGRIVRGFLLWIAGLVGAGAFVYGTAKGWFK